MSLHAIILSANRLPFTEVPAFNLDILGNKLLHLQCFVLRECGINTITVVTGFQHDQIDDDVNVKVNSQWQTTESGASANLALFDCHENEDLIIVYGDTIFYPNVIRQVLRSRYDFTICSKMDPTASFHEYTIIENGELVRIDKDNQESFSVFTGIFYVKKHKIQTLKKLVQDHLSLGEIINRIIVRGEIVHSHLIDQGWHEINSREALEKLQSNQDFLHKLLTIHIDWTRRAAKYDQLDWANRDVLIQSILEATEGIQVNRALDLGTGTGKIMKAIKSRYPACECWGVDTNEAMLDKIEEKSNYILEIADAEDLSNIPDQYFDLITARMVFHHINHLGKAVMEVKKKLKPGGLFIICEGNPPSIRVIDWYTEMFSYKEERNTLTEVDLINLFIDAEFSAITTKTVIMKKCSLNNWLNNSGLPQENIEIITKLHYEAPEYVKKDYKMEFFDHDCFMEWKFAVVFGFLPADL